jgi:lipoprotein
MKSFKRILYVGGILLASALALSACDKKKDKPTPAGSKFGTWKLATLTVTRPASTSPDLTINVDDATASTASITAFVTKEFPDIAEQVKGMVGLLTTQLPSIAKVTLDFEDDGTLKVGNLPNNAPDATGTWKQANDKVTINITSLPTDKLGANAAMLLGLLAGKDVEFTKNGNSLVHTRGASDLLTKLEASVDKLPDAMKPVIKGMLVALKAKYNTANITITLTKKE